MSKKYILTLSCKDVRGIVAAVSGFLAENGGFIVESAQYGDESTGRFFMRVEFSAEKTLSQNFEEKVARHFSMEWTLTPKEQKSRVLILVSKAGHCLNDVLYRHATGQLNIEISAIASNHPDLKRAAEFYDIPFFHLPEGKAKQEEKILELIGTYDVDVTVLARYMQILSPALCKQLMGRAINIHHSFLPSFKGAKPYTQAFDRGVKLIGATAHYVTTDLDEGPIIEQEVARVDHTQTPAELAAIGHDIECLVLARALKYHTEHRVLLNGQKTVVFK